MRSYFECLRSAGIILFTLISCAASINWQELGATEIKSKERVDFQRDILPILSSRCFSCHGPKKQEAGLRLDSRAALIRGKNEAAAIKPGDAKSSELIKRIRSKDESFQMPPSGTRLEPKQITLLELWINQGAKGLPDSPSDSTYQHHWAFQPIKLPKLPQIKDQDWIRNPVDRFVLAKLERENIRPSDTAPRTTLIRRLYLDLIGLPPDWDRVEEFMNDKRSNAYERLVDELLSSPSYGERWGRHWLDVARYADSTGYESDQPRQIWAYRDWVINALNQDMPFDQFVIEQLAGDLLSNATIAQRIATGFHCNAMLDPGVRWESVIDRVNTTGTVFLGLTAGCSQCHAHKTDPISHREFYQLYAFFNEATISPIVLETGQAPTKDDKRDQSLVMKKTPQATHIFIRGEHSQLGEKVLPGFPQFLSKKTSKARLTRVDLANWIVATENPLTARVTVNRVWQRFFGLGLVETENDFGVQTPPPTHPQLLDYLAHEFRSNRWSLKQLHRLIVTSATYRQSSNVRRDLQERDPRNRLLARQQRLRLESEIIRDVCLHASGLLSRNMNGPSVFPYQPPGILDARATPAKWEVSQGEDRLRRGVYTWVWRLTPHPHLPLFDSPDGVTTCTRRDRSNVPVQALTMLNDPTFVEAAQTLGRRVLSASSKSDVERIELLFQIVLSRNPTDQEVVTLHSLLQQQRNELTRNTSEATRIARDDHQAPSDLAPWIVAARVVLNLDETISRE